QILLRCRAHSRRGKMARHRSEATPDMNKGWLGLLLLAGCSSVQWDKPGATPTSVDADLRAGSTVAHAVTTVPPTRTMPGAAETQPPPPDRDADRQLQEAQRVQACMREKGYTLRPG